MRVVLSIAAALISWVANAQDITSSAMTLRYDGDAAPAMTVAEPLACGGIADGAQCYDGCLGDTCLIYICQGNRIVRNGAKVCHSNMQPYCTGYNHCP